MRDSTTSVLAGVFLMVIVWRMKRFGVLPRLEAAYLSWERRSLAFVLWIAPVPIPGLMLGAWGIIGFLLLTTKNNSVGNLFLGWTVLVWFLGPLFERHRLLFRVISRWYQTVASSESASDKSVK